jgi:tetratricopeptide (TPR) repeat protein
MNKLVFTFAVVLLSTISSFAQQDKLTQAFAKSYQLEKNADYKGAITTLKEQYGDGSYDLNLRLGWLTYMNAQYNESMTYYGKAIAQMPYSIEAKLGYVNPASALGMWDRVTDQYMKILAIDPQNTSVNYRMGMIHYNKKDYKNAYRFFEKVANLYPFDYDNTLMYAWTNFQLGKLREAKLLFQKVLLISPDDKSALEGLYLIK